MCAIEATINIYISLTNKEEPVLKHFSASSSNLPFAIIWCNIILVISEGNTYLNRYGILIYLVYLLQYYSVNIGRVITITSHFYKEVKDLCVILKCKLETSNPISDNEKSRHINDFTLEYITLHNNLDEALISSKPKVFRFFCNKNNKII